MRKTNIPRLSVDCVEMSIKSLRIGLWKTQLVFHFSKRERTVEGQEVALIDQQQPEHTVQLLLRVDFREDEVANSC